MSDETAARIGLALGVLLIAAFTYFCQTLGT